MEGAGGPGGDESAGDGPARLRMLVAVLVVLLLAVVVLSDASGPGARAGQAALIVAMAAMVALIARAGHG